MRKDVADADVLGAELTTEACAVERRAHDRRFVSIDILRNLGPVASVSGNDSAARALSHSGTRVRMAVWTRGTRVCPPTRTTEVRSACAAEVIHHVGTEPRRSVCTTVKFAMARASSMGCDRRPAMSAQTASN